MSTRTWLAVADALLWPGLVAWGALSTPRPGLMANMAATLMFFWAWRRVHRALGRDEVPQRYRFTTWLVVRILGIWLIAGWVLVICVSLTTK